MLSRINRKFFNTFLFFNLIILINSAHENSEYCKELKNIIYSPYTESILYITKNIEILSEKSQSCIDILVKNGKLEELDYYLNELAKKGIKYRENLSLSVNTMKKQLEEIHNKHRFEVKEYQKMSPSFRWAQSLDNIYIEIKYSNRHDSPGCLEIKDMNIDIKNDSLTFEGYCVLADVPIKIDFHIETYQGINVIECSHGEGSVGRYQIRLRKKERSYWKKLLKDEFPVPNNMRIWIEMKEKYEQELKEYEKNEEENDKNIKKRRKIKKKGNKLLNETNTKNNQTTDL